MLGASGKPSIVLSVLGIRVYGIMIYFQASSPSGRTSRRRRRHSRSRGLQRESPFATEATATVL